MQLIHSHFKYNNNYYYVENGIPILNYYENKEDTELLDLMEYLKQMLTAKDVRDVNKKAFKLK